MRAKTLKTLLQAALPLASCLSVLTVLSVARSANAQMAHTGKTSGNTTNGLVWAINTVGSATTQPPAITPQGGGRYTADWKGFKGNFTLGIGWFGPNSPGAKSTVDPNNITNVTYNIAGFGDSQKASVSVYGFTNPDPSHSTGVEFYIVQDWTGDVAPGTNGTRMASNQKIGDDFYDVFLTNNGSQIQYFSVRTAKASHNANHTVNVTAHFQKWATLKMTSGTRKYMFLSTEGLTQAAGTTATGSVDANVVSGN